MSGKAEKGISSEMIIIIILATVTILTWIVPAGEFLRDENRMVISGSYQAVASSPVGPWGLLLAIYDGFVDGGSIIFFLMFSAAYVSLLVKINAFHASVGALLRIMGDKDILIIPVFFTLFSVAGATIGLGQATYALVPVFVALCIALGYDRLVGTFIVLAGAGVGFASALTNPSTVVIASDIAGIPLMTPGFLAFRITALVIFTAASVIYVTRYAIRIRKNPELSYEYGYEKIDANALSRDEIAKMEFTGLQKISMLGFLVIMVAIIWGSIQFKWGMRELSALFLMALIITAVINHMGVTDIFDIFVDASKSMMRPAVIIALARAISTVMTAGHIIDTIVNVMGVTLNALPPALAPVGMLCVQTLINFFIPSGSGQAVAVMPIMAPLSDLVNLPRFVSVTAYQYGDGFSNFVWPTGCADQVAVTGTGFNRWYKFMGPWYLLMFVLQCLLVTASALIFS